MTSETSKSCNTVEKCMLGAILQHRKHTDNFNVFLLLLFSYCWVCFELAPKRSRIFEPVLG